MSVIETLLSRLAGVRQSRKNSWMCRCPAHNGEGRSLAVTYADDGRILIHCFAYECDVADVLAAVGMGVRDLFPEPLHHHLPPRKLGVSPMDVLRVMRHEIVILEAIAHDYLAEGRAPEVLCERAGVAAARIKKALALCDG